MLFVLTLECLAPSTHVKVSVSTFIPFFIAEKFIMPVEDIPWGEGGGVCQNLTD